MPTKLTKRFIDSLSGSAERQYVFDTEVSGFGMAVMPSGVRSFFVQYRTPGGRRGRKRRVKIGRYGQLTVEEARASAKKLLADVVHGADPSALRRSQKTNPTVSELGVRYLANVDDHKKPTTAREYHRIWEKHVVPEIGSTLVQSVQTAHLSQMHRRLRKTPYLANRVLALLAGFFTYAERQGVRSANSNPVRGIDIYRERSRERFLTPAEIQKLGNALTQAEKHGLPPAPYRTAKPATGPTAKHRPKNLRPQPANGFAIAAIRFLLLTGFREREALTLRWSDVDLAKRVAVLPDTKTGRSVRRVGAAATTLLASLPRVKGSAYVFPGASDGQHLVEINRVWYSVRHASKLDDVRLHDLRHSFASAVASAGGSLLMIRNLLGHRTTSTTAKYAHLLEDPVQNTADNTAADLALLLNAQPCDTELSSPA